MTTARDVLVMLHCAVTGIDDSKDREGHSPNRMLVHDWSTDNFSAVRREEIGVVDYGVAVYEGWTRMEITTSDRREFDIVIVEKHPLPRRVT